MSKEEVNSYENPLMPADLEGMALRLSEAMVKNLSPKQQERLCFQAPENMTKKVRNELHHALMLGMWCSEDFRTQVAKAALLKPLEATKQQTALVPKSLEVDGEIRHQYAIVVPATLDDAAWNDGQKALGDELDAGWGATSPWGNIQDAVVVKED